MLSSSSRCLRVARPYPTLPSVTPFRPASFSRSPFFLRPQRHTIHATNEPPLTSTLAFPSAVKGNLQLRCTEFDVSGAKKTNAGEFSKSDICQRHSLLPRDLRGIDSHSPYQKPTILVRSEAVLINMAHLKALIKSDLVVLFDTFGSTDSYNQKIFMSDFQERLRTHSELPFEFRALEAILVSVTNALQTRLEVLEGPVNKLLGDLEELADVEESVKQSHLRDLLQYSKKLSKFEKDALSIHDAISDVLDNDDDLAAMYLTAKKAGKPRNSSDHEEVELLLEAYLKQTEEIAGTASELISNMRSTEEIVRIILDVSRNSLMWFDIRLSVVTLATSLTSAIGALYGMNLLNGFESHPYAFYGMAGFALAVGAGAYKFAVRKLKLLARINRTEPIRPLYKLR